MTVNMNGSIKGRPLDVYRIRTFRSRLDRSRISGAMRFAFFSVDAATMRVERLIIMSSHVLSLGTASFDIIFKVLLCAASTLSASIWV